MLKHLDKYNKLAPANQLNSNVNSISNTNLTQDDAVKKKPQRPKVVEKRTTGSIDYIRQNKQFVKVQSQDIRDNMRTPPSDDEEDRTIHNSYNPQDNILIQNTRLTEVVKQKDRTISNLNNKLIALQNKLEE